MAFHPYLFFGGNCREAFDRYKEIFGGELFIMTMKEMPSEDPVAEDQADLIAHAALMYEGHLLMGSDDPSDSFSSVQGMQVNYSVADVAEAQRAFSALTEGGQTTLPIAPTSWSPMFGMCVDRFGIPWMVSTDSTSPPG
jgi:PhnB protein